MAKKILLVDDDADQLRLLARRLERSGYRVAFASDGVSCMKAIREEQPDLILLDLGMPAGDGFVTLERIHGQPQLTHAPVVVLTGRDEPEARDRVHKLGAAAFLTKPVSRDDLLATVWRFVEAPPA